MLIVDADDSGYEHLRLPKGWRLEVNARAPLGEIQNKAFWENPNEPWYGLLGDDVIPRTRGWDERLIEAAGTNCISYCDDGLNGPRQLTHPVIGGDLARELGWLILPGLDRLYGDTVLHEIAQDRGCLKYLPDVLLEHMHFSNGKSPIDETYVKKSASADHAIYEAWKRPLNIVCVNAGNYLGRGREYVTNLFDAVSRNLPKGSYRFVCFTDEPFEDNGIDFRPLPDGLAGWWNKLYLFKSGLFKDGERVMFLDLDTLIIGQLDEIVKYSGPFATLRDFWRPEGLGPAVMLWEAGKHAEIWERFEREGRPLQGNGDQTWLENYFTEKPDILQDLYPGSFVSFKTHCLPYPPTGTKVVCFHGLPRPHECDGWVKEVWKVGGSSVASVWNMANTRSEKVAENIRYASSLDLPWLEMETAHDRPAIICGGGPSLRQSFAAIKAHKERIFAVNGVGAFLAAHDIIPYYHVLMDARPENAKFLASFAWSPEYLVSSQCDLAIFDALAGTRVTVFHMHTPEMLENLPPNNKPVNLISSGSTVGLAAMAIAYTKGHRVMHLYGFDSSFEDDHHAYPQPGNDADLVVDAMAGNRKFKTTPWMVKQVQEFQDIARNLAELGCVIQVHGDGLLPHVARLMTIQEAA